MNAVRIALGDNRLELLPERAVWWSARQTLILADLHLGKTAILRRAGIPVPEGPDEVTLQRIDSLVGALNPTRLLLLGDVIHGNIQHQVNLIANLQAWRIRNKNLVVEAIVGNHDRHRDVIETLIAWRPTNTIESGLMLCHEPPTEAVTTPWIGGHWHPMARIRAGGDALRLPVFSLEPTDGLVLPAFGEFTGGMDLKRASGRQRFIATDQQVLAID